MAVTAISSLGLATAALADHGDVARPDCADISTADFFYNPADFATVDITTAQPSCKGVTYTLVVEVDPGEVVTTSVRGTGTTLVQIQSGTFSDADGLICAYVTSSRGGRDGQNQAFDRLPNAGATTGECVELIPGGSGGAPTHG